MIRHPVEDDWMHSPDPRLKLAPALGGVGPKIDLPAGCILRAAERGMRFG